VYLTFGRLFPLKNFGICALIFEETDRVKV